MGLKTRHANGTNIETAVRQGHIEHVQMSGNMVIDRDVYTTTQISLVLMV